VQPLQGPVGAAPTATQKLNSSRSPHLEAPARCSRLRARGAATAAAAANAAVALGAPSWGRWVQDYCDRSPIAARGAAWAGFLTCSDAGPVWDRRCVARRGCCY
jgi:hypothetical protein